MAVTSVIYLSGWGPALGMAYTFSALADMEQSGAEAWRAALGWSLVGCATGQLLVWYGWAPSLMTRSQAETIGVLTTGMQALPSYGERVSSLQDNINGLQQRLTGIEAAFGPLTGYVAVSVLLYLGGPGSQAARARSVNTGE